MTRKNFLTIIILLILIIPAGSSVSYAATKEAEQFFQMGMKSIKKRQFDKASLYFSKAIDKSPEYKEAWYELGNTNFAVGKYNKAMDNYYVALEIDPTYKKALKKIGSCFLKQNNYQMAVFKMEKARDYYPDDPDIRFLLGQAYEGAKQKRKALTSYNKARELQPEKYGFLKEKVKLLEDSLSVDVKSDDPSPTPMLTGPPLPEELPDPTSTPGSAETPNHIDETTAAVLEHTSPSPEDSPKVSPEEPQPAETSSNKGTDIPPESLNEKYDDSTEVGDKRKQILGIIRIGIILTFLLLILTGGLHLLREHIKSQKRRVVLDRLDSGKSSAISAESSGDNPEETSSHSSLFRDRWKKQKEEGETEEHTDTGNESGKSGDKEVEEKTLPDTLFLQETKDGGSKGSSLSDLKADVKDDDKKEEETPINEHTYYRDVITGEKVRRKHSSRKLLSKMRARLRIEDLPDKSRDSNSSIDPEGNEKIGYSKEFPADADKKVVGEDVTLNSSDFQLSRKTEEERKNSESPLKIRPLPDARDMKKRVDPFVCVCGKIVRDGSYICPRCGRGTR